MNEDDKFMKEISRLKHEQPSEELYRRIMTVVPHLQQLGPEKPVPRERWLERFFGEWRYALSVKCASLVLLAVIGFCLGRAEGLSMQQDFFSQIITGDIGWED